MNSPNKISSVEIFGKAFGYPECCISDFTKYKMREMFKNRKPIQKEAIKFLRKTYGDVVFIPCPTCSYKIIHKEILLENIFTFERPIDSNCELLVLKDSLKKVEFTDQEAQFIKRQIKRMKRKNK